MKFSNLDIDKDSHFTEVRHLNFDQTKKIKLDKHEKLY